MHYTAISNRFARRRLRTIRASIDIFAKDKSLSHAKSHICRTARTQTEEGEKWREAGLPTTVWQTTNGRHIDRRSNNCAADEVCCCTGCRAL